MNAIWIGVLGGICIALGGCAAPASTAMVPAVKSACAGDDFTAYHRCVLGLSTAQLGFETAAQRQQYLIYAEKLAQDRLEGLPDAAALNDLAGRYQQLLTNPLEAPQCARFAERILCY